MFTSSGFSAEETSTSAAMVPCRKLHRKRGRERGGTEWEEERGRGGGHAVNERGGGS